MPAFRPPAGLEDEYDPSYTNRVKTAISIPDDIFAAAERAAEGMGLSRSALYARAVADFVARHDDARVTERLDAVYAEPAPEAAVDKTLAMLQFLSLPAEEW